MTGKLGIGILAALLILLAPSWNVLVGMPVDPSGNWRSEDVTDGAGSLVVIDRTGIGEWSVASHPADPCASPLIQRKTSHAGTLRRTRPRPFAHSWVSSLMATDGTVIGARIVNGTANGLEDGSSALTDWYAIYSPDQDPFGGDPPALGRWGRYTGHIVGVPVTYPCGP